MYVFIFFSTAPTTEEVMVDSALIDDGVWAYPTRPRNPTVSRELLYEGGVFTLKLPQKRFRIMNSEFVGHPYTPVLSNRHADGGLVRTFLHPGNYDLQEIKQTRREKSTLLCTVSVWKNVREDGTAEICLDYVPTDAAHPTKRLRAIRREEGDKYPEGISGTIISITLPDDVGFVIIGDRSS